MEDTNNHFNTSAKPSILDIKPIEEQPKEVIAEAPKEEDLEVPEIKEDDAIFVKPVKKTKKKVISERQKKHLENMRRKRQEKAELKRQEKAKQQINKKKSEPIPIPKKDNFKDLRPIEQKPKTIQRPKQGLSNEEYLKQFLGNVNLLMDTVGKINKNRQFNPSIPHELKKTSSKKVQKPKNVVPLYDKPQSIDWTKSEVLYKNYKNPFGI